MNDHPLPDCARCPFPAPERVCRSENGKGPGSCPTKKSADTVARSLSLYENPEIGRFARNAALQEAEGYGDRHLGYERVRPIKTRIEEIVEFSRKMGYRRLGLAFCVGLRQEAAIVADYFIHQGFETASAVCKVGRTPKEILGIGDDQKIAVGKFESMCNPVAQALLMNRAAVDFNVLLGLCVGHDSLFLKHAEAPCTILAVKDRVLCHNPLGAVYQMNAYYRSLKTRPDTP